MNAYFWASYILLWLLVAPLVALNLVLFRQLGIMIMGTARGVHQSGLPRGRRLPAVRSTAVGGAPWSTESLKGQPHVLLFASPGYQECANIMPELDRVRDRFGITPVVLMFADLARAADYAKKHRLTGAVVEATQELAAKLDVEVSPFAYGVDAQGIVRAKGLVNTRRQLEDMAQAALGQMIDISRPSAPGENVDYRQSPRAGT